MKAKERQKLKKKKAATWDDNNQTIFFVISSCSQEQCSYLIHIWIYIHPYLDVSVYMYRLWLPVELYHLPLGNFYNQAWR